MNLAVSETDHVQNAGALADRSLNQDCWIYHRQWAGKSLS
jgi:hypothetical protein